MKKLLPLLCSLTLLLAVAGCQSSPVRERLIQPDKLQVPPLPAWIREPRLQPTLTQRLPQALQGLPEKATPQSSD
jgi:hypothetical protein